MFPHEHHIHSITFLRPPLTSFDALPSRHNTQTTRSIAKFTDHPALCTDKLMPSDTSFSHTCPSIHYYSIMADRVQNKAVNYPALAKCTLCHTVVPVRGNRNGLHFITLIGQDRTPGIVARDVRLSLHIKNLPHHL